MNAAEGPPAPDDAPSPGDILEERYRVVGEVGSGGMGVVYRAEHLRLRRHVAIKMLRQPYSGAQDLRPRFEREARALAALSHPNIVTVTDYGVHAGHPFLVMELVEGRTLRSIIDEGGVPVERAVEIARQLLEGVAFAHHRGLVHRDIKPANILLQPLESGRELVKILDFGFAKFVEGDGSEHGAGLTLTRSTIGFGTPAYIPPEQATGGMTDARTDVYSLGVVLFELLTGQQPFQGDIGELVPKHLIDPVPRFTDVRPDLQLAPALQAIVDKAMAKKQDDRFDDASAMLAALREVHEPSVVSPLPFEQYEAEMSELRELRDAPSSRPPGTGSSELGLPALRTVAAKKKARRGFGVYLAVAVLVAIGLGVYLAQPDDIEAGRRAITDVANEAAEQMRERELAHAERALPPEADEAEAEVEAPPEAAAAPPEAAAEEPEPEPDPEPVVEVEPTAERVDPWAGAVPRELARLKRRVYGRGRITDTLLRQLRQYAREHRDDPRPSLLLGDAYLRKGWSQDALERYELAYTLSPDARNDPRMLSNLVRIVVTVPVMAPKTGETIERIYGAEARDAVQEGLRSPDADTEARRRLRALLRELPR